MRRDSTTLFIRQGACLGYGWLQITDSGTSDFSPVVVDGDHAVTAFLVGVFQVDENRAISWPLKIPANGLVLFHGFESVEPAGVLLLDDHIVDFRRMFWARNSGRLNPATYIVVGVVQVQAKEHRLRSRAGCWRCSHCEGVGGEGHCFRRINITR